MMKESEGQPKKPRRKRFEPGNPEHEMNALKRAVLLQIAECWFLTTPQVAQIMGMSEQAVRTHLRNLLDLGYIEGRGVERSALAGPGAPNDYTLLGGRAPTVHVPTLIGLKHLNKHKLLEERDFRQPNTIGPKNPLFLKHEVKTRDVQVWLTLIHRMYPGHEGVQSVAYDTDTWINLGRVGYPNEVRPDATFTYRFKNDTMAAFVEVDRDTQTRPITWENKFRQYEALFQTNLIEEVTGIKRARIIVTAPDPARRDWIARILNAMYEETTMPPNRFWLITDDDLIKRTEDPQTKKITVTFASLTDPVWRVPDITSGKQPFLEQKFL